MVKKKGDRPDLLTKEEMDRLINVVGGDLFFTTFYKILKFTGRRTGEIVGTERNKKLTGGIRLKDIDFEKNQLRTYILKTKKRKLQVECSDCDKKFPYIYKFCPICQGQLPQIDKTNLKYDVSEEIIIPIKQEAMDILKVYIDQRRPKFNENNFLFRKYSLSYLKKKIKKDCKQASIEKKFSLHGFRHYFITQCKRAGLTNEEIGLWTGHKNVATLNIYNRMLPKDVEDKILNVEL